MVKEITQKTLNILNNVVTTATAHKHLSYNAYPAET